MPTPYIDLVRRGLTLPSNKGLGDAAMPPFITAGTKLQSNQIAAFKWLFTQVGQPDMSHIYYWS